MADEENPENPGNEHEGNAVPSEQAAEIAGSAEDAPLEAAQEAQQSGAPAARARCGRRWRRGPRRADAGRAGDRRVR